MSYILSVPRFNQLGSTLHSRPGVHKSCSMVVTLQSCRERVQGELGLTMQIMGPMGELFQLIRFCSVLLPIEHASGSSREHGISHDVPTKAKKFPLAQPVLCCFFVLWRVTLQNKHRHSRPNRLTRRVTRARSQHLGLLR